MIDYVEHRGYEARIAYEDGLYYAGCERESIIGSGRTAAEACESFCRAVDDFLSDWTEEEDTTAQTVPLEREAVREYLDSCIRYWRDYPSPHARYYIDAFQSVRTSLFGETLPKEADSE